MAPATSPASRTNRRRPTRRPRSRVRWGGAWPRWPGSWPDGGARTAAHAGGHPADPGRALPGLVLGRPAHARRTAGVRAAAGAAARGRAAGQRAGRVLGGRAGPVPVLPWGDDRLGRTRAALV